MFETLEKLNLESLFIDLSRNEIDDNCMLSLGKLIKQNKIEGIKMSQNNITDNGIEILSEYLFGNTSLKLFDFPFNRGITNKSIPIFKQIAMKSTINESYINGILSLSDEEKQEMELLLSIPINEREIPLITFGDVKSASKLV